MEEGRSWEDSPVGGGMPQAVQNVIWTAGDDGGVLRRSQLGQAYTGAGRLVTWQRAKVTS